MSAVIRRRFGQGFNVFMALTVAFLMTPLVPGSIQIASADDNNDWARGDGVDSAGLLTTVIVNQYDSDDNGSISQLININDDFKNAVSYSDAEVKSAIEAAAQGAALADLQKSAADEIKIAVNKKIVDDATGVESAAIAWLNTADGSTAVDAAKTSAIQNIKNAHPEYNDVEIVSYTAATVSAGTELAVVEDSAFTMTPNVSSYSYVGNSATFDKNNFRLQGADTNSNAITALSLSESSSDYDLNFTAVEAGEDVTIEIACSYLPVVANYKIDYQGTYSYQYAKATYKGWKFTPSFTYRYKTAADTDWVNGDSPIAADEQTVDSADIVYGDTVNNVTVNKQGEEIEAPAADDPDAIKASQVDGQKYSYVFDVVNLFPDDFSDTTTHNFTFTYGEAAQSSSTDPFSLYAFPTEKARKHAASLFTFNSEENKWFSVEYVESDDAYQLKVTPKNATNGEKSANVEWKYKDLTVTQTVKATVNKATIEYSVDPLAFRLKKDNEEEAVKAANQAVFAAIEEYAGSKDHPNAAMVDKDKPRYDSAIFGDDYDTTGTEKLNGTSVTLNPINDDNYSNYTVNDITEISIEKMQSIGWDETGIELASTNGSSTVTLASSNDASSTWINAKPAASESGYKLAYATNGTPTNIDQFSASVLSGGDGIHSVEMYDRNDDTGIIRKVTGINYKLDTLAPELTSAEATTPDGKKSIEAGNILFGEDNVSVNMIVSDILNANAQESQDELRATQSGIDTGKTSVNYRDDEGGRDINASLTARELGVNADNVAVSYEYGFTLGGNEDVAVNSIALHAVDYAGNTLDTSADKGKIPIEYARLVADADAPTLDVTWSNNDVRNGRYYAADRTMTITINEKFFNYVQDYANDQVIATIYQNGGAVITVHPSDFSEVSPNVWTYSLAFTSDADWDVKSIGVYDIIGRSAGAADESFTIDKTTPTMDVVFDNNNVSNGMYYNAARTATITVNEHNFIEGLVNVSPTSGAGNGDTVGAASVSAWSSNGDVRTATVSFPGEGVYTLSVSGVDGANNPMPSYTASEFIVDTTQPVIEISGAENATALVVGQSSQPNVVIRDTNIDTQSSATIDKVSYPLSQDDANPYTESRAQTVTEITYTYPAAEEIVQNDGVYTLNVQAMDLAGNSTSQAVSWSVNRFGSTYVIADDTQKMLNEYVQPTKLSDVKVTEYNPSGHSGDPSIEMTRDTKNTTLQLNGDYSLETNNSGWSTYSYDVYKKNYDSTGTYQMLFHSDDTAGNVSENTMENKNGARNDTAEIRFYVDGEKPICSFIDLSDGATYNETSHTAQVRIEDNMELDHAVIKIGDDSTTISKEDLASSANHQINVPGLDAAQTVAVIAYDAAGNESEIVAHNVTVTTNPIVLWRNNTLLFVGSIVLALLIVGGAAAFVVLRNRRQGSQF